MTSFLLLVAMICDVIVAMNVTNHVQLAHHWIHHEMTKDELVFHFGTDDPEKVDPETYRIIKIRKSTKYKNFSKRSDDDVDHTIHLKAFGKEFTIPLKRNLNLLSPYANIVDTYVNESSAKIVRKRMSVIEDDDEYPLYSCHYLHNSDETGAALSNCDGDSYKGFFTDEDEVFELYPADLERFKDKLPKDKKRSESSTETNEQFHIITKKNLAQFNVPSRDVVDIEGKLSSFVKRSVQKLSVNGNTKDDVAKPRKRAGKSNLVIETAIFMDKSAYDIYVRFYNGDKQKIRNMILAFVNGMQAIYHYPQLRTFIDFTIVRLELLQSEVFNTGGGERTQMLSSFCKYQGNLNPSDDGNPEHWDIGLLLSGQDFWALENGQKSTITMGLATVTGICTNEYGCVIGEIGVRNQEGRPYPSTGFTAVYVMAHEIGHNLGMSHDHTAGCDANGYIMSYSRGTKGETLWSSCSAKVIDQLDMPCLEENSSPPRPENNQAKYKNYPGLYWSAVEQCQFLLQDERAKVNHDSSNMDQICDRLLCRLDGAGTNGYFAAGPALEGTACGSNVYFCVQGSCQRRPDIQNVATSSPESSLETTGPQPKWGPWKYGNCYTGCVKNSRGAQVRHRDCIIPKPAVSAAQCQGPTTEVLLCDNHASCGSSQMSAVEYASSMCEKYRDKMATLKRGLTGEGKQASYNSEKVEQACTIFCKTVSTGEWYSPQLELSQVDDVDLFFPDGTWCNSDTKGDYFCRKNECLPLNPRAGRGNKSPDIPFLHNARPEPGETIIPDPMREYFTLGKDDKPKSNDPTVFFTYDTNNGSNAEFEQSEDAISIPELVRFNKP